MVKYAILQSFFCPFVRRPLLSGSYGYTDRFFSTASPESAGSLLQRPPDSPGDGEQYIKQTPVLRVPRELSVSPRKELYVSGVYYDDTGLKFMTGSHGTAVWTSPCYPNITTNFSEIEKTSLECGTQGCLFDVISDPSEYQNLASASNRSADLARVRARAKQLATENPFHPSRGKGLDMRACETIDQNHGFWGPWVD